MSLYRTWRPRSFADLVGQDAVVRTLRTALESRKLAHAYLFSGPRGSGKTSAAKIFARCVNCVNGPTADPDNTCEHCLAILAGTALDVLEIDAASNRGIDDIRSLREAVKFAPAQMRYKVYILDEAHAITDHGANAFLKTLEEPPPHAIFVLATTAPEKLPATILSRCQRYAFRRISVATMIERMRVIAAAEGIPIGDDALAAIAYRADGGLRDALTMLEQVAAFTAGGEPGATIGAGEVDAAFGASGRDEARSLRDAIVAGEAAESLRLIEQASQAGTDMQVLLQGVLGEYRNLLVARLNPALLAGDLSPADAQATVAAAQATPQGRIVRGLRVMADAFAAARWANARLELETAVLRLVTPSEDPSFEALAERVSQLEGAGAAPAAARAVPTVTAVPKAAASTPAPTPEPPKDAAAEPRPGEPSLQQVRAAWQGIRTRAEGERPSLRAQLSRATVNSVKDGTIVIGHIDAPQVDLLRAQSALLERAIADVLGVPMTLSVIHDRGQARSAHRGAPERAPRPAGDTLDGETGLLDYAVETIGRSDRGSQ